MPDNTDPSVTATSPSRAQKRTLVALVSVVFLIALAIGIFVIKSIPSHTQVANALSLSAVVLTGLTLIVVLMAGLVLVYFYTNVTNGNQALALPEGSIRALLAFSLVLIFVALAAFLYSNVNGDSTLAGTHERVTDATIDELKTQFTVVQEPVLITDEDANRKCVAPADTTNPTSNAQPGQPPVAPPVDRAKNPAKPLNYVDCKSLIGTQALDAKGNPLFKVTLYSRRSKDSDDFAKQIFTTLATVFISVVSFYFGSSTTSSAVAAGVRATGNDPNLTGKTPGKTPQSGDAKSTGGTDPKAKTNTDTLTEGLHHFEMGHPLEEINPHEGAQET